MKHLETIQKTLRRHLSIGYGITGGLALFVYLALLIAGGPVMFLLGVTPVLFIGIIGYFITTLCTKSERKKYNELFKEYFVESSLKKIFPGCDYDHRVGISYSAVSSTGMMQTGDNFYSNDYVSGTYKNLHFVQSDLKLTERRRDNDGNEYDATIFQGRYAIFEFKKKFNFRVEVVGKRFNIAKIPSGTGFKKFQKISTESSEFNKKFKIYTEDGLEAFYILDPAFIERVEKLGEKHGFNVALFFFDNKLHLAINDKSDSLEPPSPFKTLDESAEFERIENDIKLITDIVDVLKLEK